MRIVAFLSALALGCAGNPESREEALMASIEAAVTLPPGAADLQAYSRVYTWAEGGRKVRAVYERVEAPGRRWVPESQLPLIMDGGCGVVTLVFDVTSNRVEAISCNGEA